MNYKQCDYYVPAPYALVESGRLQCVMFDGHKPLWRGMNHNCGGLGPFTPGMDPQAYVDAGMMHLPTRIERLLMNIRKWLRSFFLGERA